MKYLIQQKATVWIEVRVKGETLEEALLAAEEEINNGNFREDPASFTLEDEFWYEDQYGKTGTL
jgi:hypothetical protein